MSKVFAIYPTDRSSSTRFLNRIHTFATRNLGKDWHCYKVHLNDADHEQCLQKSKEAHFVLFMGHGGESELHGACGKYGEMPVSSDASFENEFFYDKGVYINAQNIGIFKGQILFCLSCNSNRNSAKSLARISIENGVETFVGFGDLPTDYIEGMQFSKRCIAIYKGIIVKVIKNSITIATQSNDTIDNLVRIIKLLTTKEIQSLMLLPDFHGRRNVVNQLYKFKNEIVIFGNRYAKIY